MRKGWLFPRGKWMGSVLLILSVGAVLSASPKSYDVGEGKTLFVYDDGSTEIVSSRPLFDVEKLVGGQFVIDWDRFWTDAIPYMIASDPSLAMLDRETLIGLLKGIVEESIPDLSFIFTSKDTLLVYGEGETETINCRVDGDGRIWTSSDGEESQFGVADASGTEITLAIDELPGLKLYLKRVK